MKTYAWEGGVNYKNGGNPNHGEDGKFSSGSGGKSAEEVSTAAKALEFSNGGKVHTVSEGSGTAEMFHGTGKKDAVIHRGQTFADNQDTAERYSRKNLFSGEVNMEGLKIARVSDFNRDDANYGAIGDKDEDLDKLESAGVDVIHYEDEDPHGRAHTSFRIVSKKATDRFKEHLDYEEE